MSPTLPPLSVHSDVGLIQILMLKELSPAENMDTKIEIHEEHHKLSLDDVTKKNEVEEHESRNQFTQISSTWSVTPPANITDTHQSFVVFRS